MTRVRTVLQSATDSFNRGEMPPVRGGPETRLAISALIEVASGPGIHVIVDAMRNIEQIPDRVLYRRELWREMARTIRICEAETQPTLPGAAWHIRERGRQAGRRVEPRTVSRTLLIKGLEFDHAIVLNGDAHDAPNLYVALTRSSTSLTVLSNGPTITPRTSSPSSTHAEAEEETPHALLRDNGPEEQ